MLVDIRGAQAPGELQECEVCVVGGGTAGLTLALELGRAGIGTVVLESGGYEPDAGTRDLNRGQSEGLPYHYADGCRSRYLGGSSNCWGGWCRPMTDLDMRERTWVPNSGWPFGVTELEPYVRRAEALLKLGPPDYEPGAWVTANGRADLKRFPLEGSGLADVLSQFSRPVRLGEDYGKDLDALQSVRVFLRFNVIEFLTSGESVTAVRARTLQGAELRVQAKIFVLAAGAIESARLLLAAAPSHPRGLGNEHDVVGRYFMDHPRVHAGKVIFREPWRRNKLYDEKFHYQNRAVSAFGTNFASQLMPTASTQERLGLLHSNVWFSSMFPGEGTAAAESLKRIKDRLERKEKQGTSLGQDLYNMATHPLDSAGFVAARLFQPEWLIKTVTMGAIVEPTPDPESRVTLIDERDALGMPRVSVCWKLSDQVKHTFDKSFELVADLLRKRQIAEVELNPSIVHNGWPTSLNMEGTWHHMGTTRMHVNPKKGVVDINSRVHGMSNFFIAGSSVFPTAGVNFPTITLVALTMRLADHLRHVLRT